MLTKTKRIFVSNRLPFSIDAKTGNLQRGSGGLVSALLGVSLEDPFAWLGFETNEKNIKPLRKRSSEIKPNLQCHPVLIPKKTYDQYYDGFANDIIWPLFHYEGHLAVFNRENWESYLEANRLMAEEIIKVADEQDTVWIHDFHFLMLPQFLREKKPKLKIGFFLHIPFPSAEVFRQLPVREEILKALTHCDLVGFHEHSYLRHFLVSLKSILGIDATVFKAEIGDHTLHLGVYPISIDSESFVQKARSSEVVAQTEAYRYMSPIPYVILGVDRLDYTKGLELKLRGFQRALKKYPELVGNVSFLQVAVPTRQKVPYYAKIKRDIDQLVGSINGEFTQPHYTPVNYIFNSVEETKLLALYRRANVALVTSKRDGMNLVAMEYVMAQDLENAGVLILSEFAGASSFLGDALIINPWDVDAIADALYKAYHMSLEERRERLSNMQEILSRYSATKWAEGFLRDLDETEKNHENPVFYLSAKRLDWPSKILRSLQSHEKIKVVLDYDGTLVGLAKRPDLALVIERTKQVLADLKEKAEIIVVSGRTRKFLDQQLGDLQLQMVAEHGAYCKEPDGEWKTCIASDVSSWYSQVEKMMSSYAERVPMSFVERKEAGLVWHFRESPSDFAEFQAKKLDDELQVGLANSPMTVSMGSKIVEAKATECNKGHFLRTLLQKSSEDTFFVCIGDDRTDEDMFRVLGNDGMSIKVGLEKTQARFRIPLQRDVIVLLQELHDLLEERGQQQRLASTHAGPDLMMM